MPGVPRDLDRLCETLELLLRRVEGSMHKDGRKLYVAAFQSFASMATRPTA